MYSAQGSLRRGQGDEAGDGGAPDNHTLFDGLLKRLEAKQTSISCQLSVLSSQFSVSGGRDRSLAARGCFEFLLDFRRRRAAYFALPVLEHSAAGFAAGRPAFTYCVRRGRGGFFARDLWRYSRMWRRVSRPPGRRVRTGHGWFRPSLRLCRCLRLCDAFLEHVEGFVADHGLMRLVMKPGASLITTTSLRMRLPTSTTAARVSASVSGRARFRAASFVTD